MDISDNIKQLIADGKTLDALNLMQKFLKNKDEALLNQTYLLEAQFKDVQQKMRLGLQEAPTELNRINFTLLSLCDDLKNLSTKKVENEENEDENNDTISNAEAASKASMILGGFLILVILVGILIYFLSK